MDDLISRKEAIDKLNAIPSGNWSKARYTRELWNVPSVPAVPLDKLCEWLSDNAYMYLTEKELDNGWSSHDPAYWEMKLSKWMEEQNG